jgi:hypothetical protein
MYCSYSTTTTATIRPNEQPLRLCSPLMKKGVMTPAELQVQNLELASPP